VPCHDHGGSRRARLAAAGAPQKPCHQPDWFNSLRWHGFALLLCLPGANAACACGPAKTAFLSSNAPPDFLPALGLLCLVQPPEGALLIAGVGIILHLVGDSRQPGIHAYHTSNPGHDHPGSSEQSWIEGTHYGYSKDIILAQENTHLRPLSDPWRSRRLFPGPPPSAPVISSWPPG